MTQPGQISGTSGESPREPLRKYLADWSRWEVPRVEPAVKALLDYGQGLDARLDKRVTPLLLERLAPRFVELQLRAREELDPILGAGLEDRQGRFVRPIAMVTPEAARDWLAWGFVSAWLRLLGIEGTHHLCVCEACTLVFAPSGRKTSARYCDMHKDHPVSALPLGVWNRPPRSRGERTQVLVPELDANSTTVRTFREVTIGRCLECGDLFHGTANKKFCGDEKIGDDKNKKNCRQEYHGRVK